MNDMMINFESQGIETNVNQVVKNTEGKKEKPKTRVDEGNERKLGVDRWG